MNYMNYQDYYQGTKPQQGVGAYTQGAPAGVGAYQQGASNKPQGVGAYTQGVSTLPGGAGFGWPSQPSQVGGGGTNYGPSGNPWATVTPGSSGGGTNYGPSGNPWANYGNNRLATQTFDQSQRLDGQQPQTPQTQGGGAGFGWSNPQTAYQGYQQEVDTRAQQPIQPPVQSPPPTVSSAADYLAVSQGADPVVQPSPVVSTAEDYRNISTGADTVAPTATAAPAAPAVSTAEGYKELSSGGINYNQGYGDVYSQVRSFLEGGGDPNSVDHHAFQRSADAAGMGDLFNWESLRNKWTPQQAAPAPSPVVSSAPVVDTAADYRAISTGVDPNAASTPAAKPVVSTGGQPATAPVVSTAEDYRNISTGTDTSAGSPMVDQSGRPDQVPQQNNYNYYLEQQANMARDQQAARAQQQAAASEAYAKQQQTRFDNAMTAADRFTPGTDPLIDPTRYGDSTALAMDPILDYTGRLEEPLIKEVEENLGTPGYDFTQAGDNTLLSALEGQYGVGGAGQLGKEAITQDPNSLQSALLSNANRIDAANPYDTRRDDIIAGQDSEVDRLYDQEFARIQNEFAVNNNLGSPAYTQSLQDMQDQKARAKLGIRSEFGRTAAAQDESMASGRLDDITGAINTSRAGQVSEEAIQANRRAGAQATGGYMGTTEFDQDLRGSALEEGVRRGRVQDTGQALDRERSHVDRQMMYQQQLQQAANDEYFRALKAEEDAMYRPFQYQDAGLALAGGALGSPGTDMGAAIGGYGAAGASYGQYGQNRANQLALNYQALLNSLYDKKPDGE